MKRLLLIISITTLMVAGLQTQSVAQAVHPVTTAFVSPNPVEDHADLTFAQSINEDVTIVIKDLTGKTVLTRNPELNGEICSNIPLDLESLRRGIYILQVTSQSGKTKTIRFQKT